MPKWPESGCQVHSVQVAMQNVKLAWISTGRVPLEPVTRVRAGAMRRL